MSSDNHIPPLRYHVLTPLYDLACTIGGFGRQRQKIIKLMPDAGGKRVLDVGCGTGVMTRLLKERFPTATVIGVDPDANALQIAIAKSKGLDVSYLKGGAENLPLQDASVDIVCSTLVIHHLPTDLKHRAFREMHRVLKKGGLVLIADFGKRRGRLYSPLSWFTITFEHGRDNFDGKIPEFMQTAGLKDVTVCERFGWNIDVIGARK